MGLTVPDPSKRRHTRALHDPLEGRRLRCTDPMFVDKDVAAAAGGAVTRRALQRMDFPHGFIQLNRRALA